MKYNLRTKCYFCSFSIISTTIFVTTLTVVYQKLLCLEQYTVNISLSFPPVKSIMNIVLFIN